MITPASQLAKGRKVYRKHRLEHMREIKVVKVTKNTIQFRDWNGLTFFVTKHQEDGSERLFLTDSEQEPT